MTAQKPGCLYIVATPIGNLDDMTFRAVKVLKDVDIIAAEDTRHTKRLLAHFSIHTKLTAIHEHNETAKAPKIISYLQKGLNIALVSDAGTPSISDPGYKLVREVARNDIIVLPVPGCNAAIAGLSVSGLPTDSFLFIGFLPKKKNKRKDAIQNIATKKTTLILYESPKRIKTLLEELIHILGDRKACLAREISKIHEEYLRGRLQFIIDELNSREAIKGECSLFIQGNTAPPPSLSDNDIDLIIINALKDQALSTAGLAKKLAQKYSISKNIAYDKIISIKQKK